MIKPSSIKYHFKIVSAFIFSFLYLPHILCFAKIGGKKSLMAKDIAAIDSHSGHILPIWFSLIFHLHNDRYFRSLFYYRIGIVASSIIGWYRRGDRYLTFATDLKMGGGCLYFHPYATVINASIIGDNFRFKHCTTVGNKSKNTIDDRPVIGNNVSLGANVTIIGPVTIGDNVIIGAGSVVVKDIPSNCIAAGNPAIVKKYI